MMVIVKMSAYRTDLSRRTIHVESVFCIGSHCGDAGCVGTFVVGRFGPDFGVFHKLLAALTVIGSHKHSSFPLKRLFFTLVYWMTELIICTGTFSYCWMVIHSGL